MTFALQLLCDAVQKFVLKNRQEKGHNSRKKVTAEIQTTCRGPGGTHQGTGRAGVRGGCGGQVIGSGGKTESGSVSRAKHGKNASNE